MESSMNRGVLRFAATAAIALWSVAAAADPVAIPANIFLPTQGGGQYLARDLLLGGKVYNSEGKIIGDIEDLILNSNNQIEGVVMGTGGFAGFGEKHVAVVLSALQIKNENGKITISLPQATKEVLDALEPFQRTAPAKSLLDRAIEKAQELTDKGSVTAKDAYDKAKVEAGPALEKAKEQAKETYEEIKKEAGPALEKAKEQAKDAYHKAREAVETLPETGPAAPGTKPVAPEAKPASPPESTPATPAPAP
jgi:sporulation protein YlmC with PRC-barrel domain